MLRKEMEFYKNKQNRFGLPLDNGQPHTKLDWFLRTAILTQDREDFQTLVDPVVRYLNETPERVPMTDWYLTDSGRRRGFTARPVVGGVFPRMLYDRELWISVREFFAPGATSSRFTVARRREDSTSPRAWTSFYRTQSSRYAPRNAQLDFVARGTVNRSSAHRRPI
jgi:Glutaminase A six helical-hairpin domain